MLEQERHSLILKLVEERSIVSVGDLLDLLGASEATIRRDINTLAERGEVKRIRGGAEAVRPRHQPHLVGMPFALSQDISVPQKRAIARAAAELIAPGESIIINGGTTTFALVEFLADSRSRHPHQFVSDRGQAARHQPQSHHAAGRHDLPRTEHRAQPVRERHHRELLGQQAVHRLLWPEPLRHHGSRSADRAGADQAAEAHRGRDRDGRQQQAAPQVRDDRHGPRSHHHHHHRRRRQARRAGGFPSGGHQSDRRHGEPKKTSCRNSPEQAARQQGRSNGGSRCSSKACSAAAARAVRWRAAASVRAASRRSRRQDPHRHRRQVARQRLLRRRSQGRRRSRAATRRRNHLHRPDDADRRRTNRNIECADRAARRCHRDFRQRSGRAGADAASEPCSAASK